jgi:hypothetical protein
VRYAGVFTEQEIMAGFASVDVNGNGVVCGKPFSPGDKKFPLQQLHDDLAKP